MKWLQCLLDFIESQTEKYVVVENPLIKFRVGIVYTTINLLEKLRSHKKKRKSY